MTLLRRLSAAALTLAFLQIVFGAIVRISGSGMGCGDHWPKCHGRWFPPLDRPDLVVEITHRWIAATLVIAVVALLVAAMGRRREPGVGGRDGVLRSAALAAALVVTAAVLGAVTVKLGLAAPVVVAHLAIAMSLLATLVVSLLRTGGLGAGSLAGAGGSGRTFRAAAAAAALAFAALVFGALTANLPGAAASCVGFPLCRGSSIPAGGAQHVHITHRVIAFLLLFHLLGLTIAVARRREDALLVRASRVAFGAVAAQILIAAALVEMRLPPVLQSLHQAAGTFVWLSVFTLAALAYRASRGATRLRDRASQRIGVATERPAHSASGMTQ